MIVLRLFETAKTPFSDSECNGAGWEATDIKRMVVDRFCDEYLMAPGN